MCHWASTPGSHAGHEHWDRQLLVGRENWILWSHFLVLISPDFSVRRERAYIAQSLVCSSGSGIWTLQSHPISYCLKICLSFACKSVFAWGSEFLPLDIQLFQDWAAQGEVLLVYNALSWSASTPAGGPGWQRQVPKTFYGSKSGVHLLPSGSWPPLCNWFHGGH